MEIDGMIEAGVYPTVPVRRETVPTLVLSQKHGETDQASLRTRTTQQ